MLYNAWRRFGNERGMKNQSRNIWPRLLGRVRPHRAALALGVFAAVLSAGAASMWASLLGPLLHSVIQGGDATWGPLHFERDDLLLEVPALVVGLAAIKAVSGWLQAGLMGHVAQGVLATLRKDLYGRLLELAPNWFEVRHSGELLSRFTSDVGQVEFAVAQALAGLVKDSLMVLGLLGVCFVTDWRLFLVLFVVLPGTIIPVSRFARSAKKAASRTQTSLGALSMMAAEQLSALPVVQAMRAEDQALARFDVEQGHYLKAMKRSLFVRGAFSPTTELLGIIGVAIALVVGTQAVATEPELGQKLVSFFAAALLMYQPVKAISNTTSELSRATAAAARLYEVLDAQPQPDGGGSLGPLKHSVHFTGLRLTYSDGREALRGVDFEVPAGQMVALVGPSGAGKSSVLSVVLGFHAPNAGRVEWDGVDLETASRAARRAQLGWVSQEPVLLSGTVRENLALARADADDASMWKALEQAHAKDFVTSLDLEVGERGSRLSGGQRQRLAIARAFLRQPSLLVLDEPTSALDAGTETAVQAGLESLMAGRTTLVVAHRLSTVRRAQHIVVMDGGVVVEQGTHDTLLAQHGVYARLVAASRGDALFEGTA